MLPGWFTTLALITLSGIMIAFLLCIVIFIVAAIVAAWHEGKQK